MSSISGMPIEVRPDEDSLLETNAVFTITFSYNNKKLVCYTSEMSVSRSIETLIAKTLSNNTRDIELREALLLSEYLIVDVDTSIKYSGLEFDTLSLINSKYNKIVEERTYRPYGLNALFPGPLLEKNYALLAFRHIVSSIDREAKSKKLNSLVPEALPIMPDTNENFGRRGRAPVSYYCYTREGEFVKEFSTINEASTVMGVKAGTIRSCVAGYLPTAAGYRWSTKKVDHLEPIDNKRAKVTRDIIELL